MKILAIEPIDDGFSSGFCSVIFFSSFPPFSRNLSPTQATRGFSPTRDSRYEDTGPGPDNIVTPFVILCVFGPDEPPVVPLP